MTTLLLALAVAAPALDLDALNSDQHEIAVTLAPGADEVWFERRSGAWGDALDAQSRLLHARRDPGTGGWAAPSVPPFAADSASDGEPFFDASSNTLYFVSDRTHPTLGDSGGNIWRVSRDADGVWAAPEALPAPVNAKGHEYSPVWRNDRLYFASDRHGDGDLFVASATDTGWSLAPLGSAVNSATGEWNLWVSPDEDLLVFEASGRDTNITVPGDLYASVKDERGAWLPAVPLERINGPGSELNPRIFGDVLVYASPTTSL